jgi:hypothetical protein
VTPAPGRSSTGRSTSRSVRRTPGDRCRRRAGICGGSVGAGREREDGGGRPRGLRAAPRGVARGV